MGRPVDQLTPKGAATRRDILRAAARVFDAKGYSLARMDDVVRETGLTKGAVYFHFKS
ncbi:TetR family transcriptional regulator, partial [Streptomyces anulatus]